ncbi:MAG: hypothetical protein ACREDZ_16010 [Kiloniellales bacterium]
MAYQSANLELLAGGGAGISIWGYRSSADSKAAIDSAGYFDAAAAMLRVGDWLIVNASDGHGISVVNANASGTVDTSDAVAVGAADTD